MSLPKKNTRTVSVDDKEYRFIIKTNHQEPMLIVQEDCKEPGAPMSIKLDHVSILGGRNFGIGPGDVKQIIQKVIIAGWEPSKKGAAFDFKGHVEIERKEYTQSF